MLDILDLVRSSFIWIFPKDFLRENIYIENLGNRYLTGVHRNAGGMIACKLAAMAPDRVLSLALLNVTGGGKECIPKV